MTNINNLIGEWNNQVVGDPLSFLLNTSLQKQLLERDLVYRLNSERLNLLSNKVKNWTPSELLQSVTGTCGTTYFDLPLRVGLRPAFITPTMEEKLVDVGNLICKAINASAELVRQDEKVRITVASTARSEACGIQVRPPHQHYAPLIRTDYIWVNSNNGPPHPIVIDINLMPGMPLLSHGIAEIFDELFDNKLCSLNLSNSYRADKICKTIFDEFLNSSFFSSSPNFAFVVREGHGLTPETKLWAEMFYRLTGCATAVVYPDQIKRINNGKLQTDIGLFDAVVRRVRPITKHVETNRIDREDEGVKIISDVYCKGNLFVFPGFHLYLENHAWSYFWRCAEYASFFRQYLTSEEYLRLGTYLPKTALVQVSDTDNELLTVNWDDGTKVNCLGEIPEHYVVKRGDSTGADNLFILSDHSRNPRQRAYNYALHSIKDGIIIQQLINDTKEQYPVVAEGSDHVELVQAHMKYSAFYVNGQYIGGNAMLCPKSRKVHGGSGTYIVPLYTIH